MSSIRASLAKQTLAELRRLDGPEHRKVLELTGETIITRVESASRIEWLPVELHFATLRAMNEVMGLEAGTELFHGLFSSLVEGPAFAALVRGLRAIGIRSPASFLKPTPRSLPMIFRDCGRVEFESVDERCALHKFRGVPSNFFEPSLRWPRYAAASGRTAFEFSDTSGTVTLEDERPELGSFDLRYEW